MKHWLIKIFLVVLFILNGVSSAGETFDYIVDFMMLPSLELQMKISNPYEIQENRAQKIVFKADTKPFYSKIFAIHNRYVSIYDADRFYTLHNHKIISQPNVSQALSVDYFPETKIANYSIGEQRNVPEDTHCFFSLLMHMRKMDDFSDTLTVDLEGALYQATFKIHGSEALTIQKEKVATDKVEILLKKIDPDQEAVIDYTDVFFWKIGSEGGEQFVWLDHKMPRTIVKAKFVTSPSWLTATLVEYEK